MGEDDKMMPAKKEILIFLPDNYADWEGAYISSELNKPETGFIVKTLAVNKNPIKSMGGFTVIPDYTISEIPADFQMIILVGGTSWLNVENDEVKSVVDLCMEKKIPLAAICDACTFLAENGYLDHAKHTGNSLEYLKEFASNYQGSENFIEKQVVSTDGLITANGTAAVEFSIEILKYFDLMPQNELDELYQIFKVGLYKV